MAASRNWRAMMSSSRASGMSSGAFAARHAWCWPGGRNGHGTARGRRAGSPATGSAGRSVATGGGCAGLAARAAAGWCLVGAPLQYFPFGEYFAIEGAQRFIEFLIAAGTRPRRRNQTLCLAWGAAGWPRLRGWGKLVARLSNPPVPPAGPVPASWPSVPLPDEPGTSPGVPVPGAPPAEPEGEDLSPPGAGTRWAVGGH